MVVYNKGGKDYLLLANSVRGVMKIPTAEFGTAEAITTPPSIPGGIKYETIFGRIILPGVGTAIAAVGAALVVFPAANEYIQGPFWLLSKIFFFLFFYVWARGTLPRFRYDQLMNIGWKLLLPVSIANVIVTAGFVLFRSNR